MNNSGRAGELSDATRDQCQRTSGEWLANDELLLMEMVLLKSSSSLLKSSSLLLSAAGASSREASGEPPATGKGLGEGSPAPGVLARAAPGASTGVTRASCKRGTTGGERDGERGDCELPPLATRGDTGGDRSGATGVRPVGRLKGAEGRLFHSGPSRGGPGDDAPATLEAAGARGEARGRRGDDNGPLVAIEWPEKFLREINMYEV